MKRRLVIQFARMGDAMQSLPLLDRMRRLHPQDEIILLTDTSVAPLLERLSGIDQVFGFPAEKGWHAARQPDWQPQFEWWQKALDPLLAQQFDQVTVLNYSRMAVIVGDMVPAEQRVGYWLSSDRHQIQQSPPINLLFATVQHRRWARWHLSDIYAMLEPGDEGDNHPITTVSNAVSWQFDPRHSEDSDNKEIALIIGAGDPKRLLTIDFYVRLIDRILESDQMVITLIGGAAESERQEQILSRLPSIHRSRVRETAGEIPLTDLPTRLHNCDLVVGPDTGPLHIAAWCGVPLLGLYFASASVHQTGPYGQNCHVIDTVTPCRICREDEPCHRNDCRNALTPDSVASAIRWMLSADGSGTGTGSDCPEGFPTEELRWRTAAFDRWGITYPEVPDGSPDMHTVTQHEIFGRLLLPHGGGSPKELNLPTEFQQDLSRLCRGETVSGDSENYAVFQEFLKLEDEQGRGEVREKLVGMLSKTSDDALKLRWSVIIPVYNQCHLTRKCLESLVKTTNGWDVEIVVVDNGSTDDTAEMVDSWGGTVRRVSLGENRGFAVGCNQGAWAAKSDWLFFLNNDTEVQPGWIESLTEAAVRHGSNTILGAKLLYPDGRIQHAGVAFDQEGQPVHVGKGCSRDDPRWMDETWYPAVTAAAMGVSRLTFLKLGGFDEQYLNGYEDVDLCLKAAEQGMKSLVVPGVQIYHYQGHTPGRYQHDARNEELFQERWATTIQTHPEWQEKPVPADTITQLKELPVVNALSRHFAVVMGEPPYYPSPTLRLISPLNALKESGFLDYSVISHTDNRTDFRRQLESTNGVNAIILQRMLPQDWMMEEVLEYLDRTNTPLIVDTDDLVIGRFSNGSPRAHEHAAKEKWFLDAIRRSSVVTVSTEVLKRELARYDESARIEVLPNFVDPGIWQTNRDAAFDSDQKIRMGFFGSETHTLDLAMITPAIRHILEAHPGQVELCCWGCITEELKTLEGVRYMGPYDPDYNQYAARLPAVPVHFALVPLMSNRFNRAKSSIKYLELGISGIPGIYSDLEPYHRVVHHDENGAVVSNNTWDWVEAMSKLIEDNQHRKKIAENAKRDVIEHHMLPQHLDEWKKVLSDF